MCMKTVILAGGLGTRISEESHLKPKPMIEIGKYPIMVHIMRIFAHDGFNDFIICGGYKQQVIKEYFAHFDMYTNDVTFDFSTGERHIHNEPKFDWKVTVSDTGYYTQTGGRIKRIKDYVGNHRFFMTYGDAVGNIDVNAVLQSHIASGKLATVTVYNFGQSKGVIKVAKDGSVKSFREKAEIDGALINIGFMVLEPEVFDYIDGDDCVFENDVLPKLAKMGQLNAYTHKGFWQCMDTLRERELLEKLDAQKDCPWKVWEK